jgi:hypothetical protein
MQVAVSESNRDSLWCSTQWCLRNDEPLSETLVHVARLFVPACHDIPVCFGSSKGMFTVASLGTVPCDGVSK